MLFFFNSAFDTSVQMPLTENVLVHVRTWVRWCGSPHLSCKRDQIKMRHYMDRRITPPKRVTSPTWGPPPQCKQALTRTIAMFTLRGWVGTLDKRIQQMDTAAKLPINRLRMISQDTVRGRLLISRVNAPMCLRHSGCNDNLETSFNLCAYALSVW